MSKDIKELIKKMKNKKEDEVEIKVYKNTQYEIASHNEEYKVFDFLKNFDFVENIEKLVEGKLYKFEVKEKENYDLLKSVFEEYSSKLEEEINLKSSTKENVTLGSAPYITEYSDFQSKEEKINDYENPYEQECLKQFEDYLSINPNDVIEKMSNFIVTVSENINKKQSDLFVLSIYKEIKKINEENPNIGGMSRLNDYQIVDIHNESPEVFMKSMSLRTNINSVCELLNDSQIRYGKKYSNSFMNKMIKKAKEDSGIKEVIIKNQSEWEDSYSSNNVELEEKLDKELLNKLKQFELPDSSDLSAYNPFQFFNHYNIAEKDYSTIKPVVRELVTVFSAIHSAQFRDKIFNYFDEVLNKSKGETDPMKFMENVKDISVESFENYISSSPKLKGLGFK
jgi:hypothetical protein